MARSSSPDRRPDARAERAAGDLSIGRAVGDLLLDVADRSIRDGLAGQPASTPISGEARPPLRRRAGTFVTLHVDGDLNGCIGSLEPTEPLIDSVARHAWSAAFDDPRLPPLRVDEYERLTIEISILSPLAAVAAARRSELIATLRPGVDGLLIDGDGRRAVFLPSVWTTLRSPGSFVSELFAKAGLDREYWGTDVRAWTFTAEKISGEG